MARIGFAVAGLLGIAGLALLALGIGATPTAAQQMYFIAGAILLGCSGISLAIMTSAAPSGVELAQPVSRAEPPMRYSDPFTSPPAPTPQPSSPQREAKPDFASVSGPSAAAAASAASAVAAMSAASVSEAQPQAPEPEMAIAPAIEAQPEEPSIAAAPAMPVAPAFELPPLRPRIAMQPEMPAAPSAAAATPEPEPQPHPVPEPVPPPAAPVAAEPAPPEDEFDLEAAIAAELGVSPSVMAATPKLAEDPVEIEEIFVSTGQVIDTPQPAADAPAHAGPLFTTGIEDVAVPPEADEPPVEEAVEPAHAGQPYEEQAAYQEPAETEPPEPAAAPQGVVVGSYESGGVVYTLYEDGSVTAQAGDVIETYPSLDALRAAFDRQPA